MAVDHNDIPKGKVRLGFASMVCTSCRSILVTCTEEVNGGLPSHLPCPIQLNSGYGCEGTMQSNATVISETDQLSFFRKFGHLLLDGKVIDELS